MMIRLSVLFVSILVVIAVFTGSVSAGQLWPVDRRIDLSSGFGDFRDGHFHAGLDLRTGGRIGASVVSPVAGYVWRVSMSYYGYGKGIYIMGDDGALYVFGHLSKFSRKISDAVKAEQRRRQRYFIDVKLPRDSIRVEKGEFVAYSGQTGVGAPHLHFEKRTGDNIPVNPLTHGFSLGDKVRPELVRVGFQLTDDHSVFDNGRRKIVRPVRAATGAGEYDLDTTYYFNRPFGVLVEGFDRMRPGGMKQAVYKYQFFIDDRLYYEVVFDSLDFDNTHSVNFEYDHTAAVRDKSPVRRLFKFSSNSFPGSRSLGPGGGVFGLAGTESRGRHKARIVATDAAGNQAVVRFEFIWWPNRTVFDLDSTVTRPGDSTYFYLSPGTGWNALGIDSVRSLRNLRNLWGEPSNLYETTDSSGGYRCLVVGRGVEGAVLRIFAFAGDCVIPDIIYSGIRKEQPDRIRITHEVVEDGLLVAIDALHKVGSEARIELYDGDRLLGVEYPQYLHMERHVCFIPPRPEYRRVTRIGATMSRDPERPVVVFEDSLALFAVGHDEVQAIAVDSFFTAYIGPKNLYEPRFVELRSNIPRERSLLNMSSAHYQILPEQFVTRRPFEIRLIVPSLSVSNIPNGLCWLDKKKDRWFWLSESAVGDTLSAESAGGGSFAAVFDANPPAISDLSLTDGRTIHNPRPTIRFIAEDRLSGIYDDNDLYIKLDGDWLIPEYDPESHRCSTEPFELLSEGEHHLEIIVRDRAGHETMEVLNFFYSSDRTPGGRRR